MKDTIKNSNMYRLFKIIVISLFLSCPSLAGSDGENSLTNNSNGQVKDCFEGINRGVFAFNQALDEIIVEPLAKGIQIIALSNKKGY